MNKKESCCIVVAWHKLELELGRIVVQDKSTHYLVVGQSWVGVHIQPCTEHSEML